MFYGCIYHILFLGICSATQFRWIQKGEETEKQSWAIDHVYIGEACPKLCSGHGYCTTGAICICDEGYQGFFLLNSFCLYLSDMQI